MDAFFDKRDEKLLDEDRYTFFVMKRVMNGECALRLSDHEKLVLCYTGRPYPVWVWTCGGAGIDTLETAYRLLKENSLIRPGQRYNVKYALAEYLISRAAQDGHKLFTATNMFAYDCPDPVEPRVKADGGLHKCTENDLEELASFIEMMADELDSDKKTPSEYREDAAKFIAAGNTYFWKDAGGRSVASCKFNVNGSLASLSLVYTLKDCRRKHYAQNLVYQVTLKAKEAGCLPMLYTDADYAASNACYIKIGYVMRGRLCTVQAAQ